jgi:hypothetical protein
MIKQLHGKHYYIEVQNIYQAQLVLTYIKDFGTYEDEEFDIRTFDDKMCVMSSAKCNTRECGIKYINWDKAKSYAQALKKVGV